VTVQLIFESTIVKKKRKIQKFMGTTMSACWNNGKIKLRSVVSRIILAQKKKHPNKVFGLGGIFIKSKV
jgi:hypothetical protein